MRRVLVVAAHPDDELLGCGGTLAKHVVAGDSVRVVIVAQGAASRGGDQDAVSAEIAALEAASAAAAEVVGYKPPRHLGFPDNRLDSVPLLELVQSLESEIAAVAPTLIYTHHIGDLNVDHGIVHRAVATAARPLPDRENLTVLSFETLSSTEWGLQGQDACFRPTVFVDIEGHLETKLRALDCYKSELRAFPHPRSLEAARQLAALRGSQVGRKSAEAFCSIRQVVDLPSG